MDSKTRFSIIRRVFEKDIKTLHVSFVIILLFVIGFAFYLTNDRYYNTVVKIGDSFTSKDTIVETAILSLKDVRPEISQIKEQYQITQKIKESYKLLSNNYSSINFTLSLFFTIFSIITGILGFLLVGKGWNNTKSFYLKSSFLVSFFCATLFGTIPNVFGAKENIKNNTIKFNFYNDLQLELYTLAKDNKGYFKKNDTTTIKNLNRDILKITNQIRDNQDIYFDVFLDQVPKNVKPQIN